MISETKTFLVVVGARPNFIKAAPLFKRLSEYPNIHLELVHTGQHFDQNMSAVFFDQMNIPKPDFHLDIQGDYHTEKLGKMFSALKQTVGNGKYEGVIVFGDINSTLAGAIAATSNSKKLIHIEAGLRSHDRRMPEEINRAITDHLSDILFATEQSAVDNLLLEGVSHDKIHLVGNIMIESLEMFKPIFLQSKIVKEIGIDNDYVVATIHRAENTDDREILKKMLGVLNDISDKYQVIFPLHPGTRNKIRQFNLELALERLTVIDPIGYIDFIKLVMESKGVITDSGGIQEETTQLDIPCCTLRDNTERPITLTSGTNKLFPIANMEVEKILRHLDSKPTKTGQIPLWDGLVSKRILDVL
jgi:UDP-N-acetylglucosamine 2-epimerase (non-hydrolysing)